MWRENIEPDEESRLYRQLFDWLAEHPGLIATVAGPVLLIALISLCFLPLGSAFEGFSAASIFSVLFLAFLLWVLICGMGSSFACFEKNMRLLEKEERPEEETEEERRGPGKFKDRPRCFIQFRCK
ncbi:hypothetical protein VJ923_12075 [Adlercreutzia sp. R25]|uniref:Uncharacterized protein n=1 Tax=Adlercreutzia shanghongiae TaxID=3111773 RepID=A0ABU6J1G9_9ACTN|nr:MULTISPECIES: hypothetical protein [unclassified Adlercreutzia]MEC4273896.1 hypothetical protein [Adlercreutzia sp. R25]MEC4295992.1 hypothetical protein [Adlercreutzia sp. R22]